MSESGHSFIPATRLTRNAVRVMVLIILGTSAFLMAKYPLLPWLLPVHFKVNGLPNGWQYRTPLRVLMPVLVQLSLAASLGATGALLLSRRHGERSLEEADAKAAAAAAEAIMLMALIWVAFQAYAALALVDMWSSQRAGLGWWYGYLELHGFLLTAIVAIRARSRVGTPVPRPFVAEHWCFGQLYSNAEDPALLVPARDGRQWTLNFGRPLATALLGAMLTVGMIGPTAILVLLLR